MDAKTPPVELPVARESLNSKLYICPNETHPITRAVHLSRLAAYYPKCGTCPLRTDAGQLPRHTASQMESAQRRVQRPSLVTTESLRGTYLNEVTRTQSREIAAALAALLWQDAPLVATLRADQLVGRARPLVVVGHDERTSSPDIVTGAVSALRRMGCNVIDIGVAVRPTFWFAVNHLSAAAGLFVSGSGCDPSWTGFDFCGRGGTPWSDCSVLENRLRRIESQLDQPISRATRRAGNIRLFNTFVPYEAGLWKHFHALRPLNVVVGTSQGITIELLQRLFGKLPCRLHACRFPLRKRDPSNAEDRDVATVADEVLRRSAHFGFVIDDDGQRCSLIDDNGQLVDAGGLFKIVVDALLADEPTVTVAVHDRIDFPSSRPLNRDDEPSRGTSIVGRLQQRANVRFVETGPTFSEMQRTMTAHEAQTGVSQAGFVWLKDSMVTCDAILTLAKVLQSASLSDQPISMRCRH
ncbi:MAG: hypothetical protein O3A00_10170 [Planctomycetota bacterium]|nr:hypothetical protein [Planctomycetota bacterium]